MKMDQATESARKAIAINALDVRDNDPIAWFPLVMLCMDPTFSPMAEEARDLLAERSLIEVGSGGQVSVHDMVREVVLALA